MYIFILHVGGCFNIKMNYSIIAYTIWYNDCKIQLQHSDITSLMFNNSGTGCDVLIFSININFVLQLKYRYCGFLQIGKHICYILHRAVQKQTLRFSIWLSVKRWPFHMFVIYSYETALSPGFYQLFEPI